VLITTDQQTAERNPEPLRTLASYRTLGQKNKVMFGLNTIGPGAGLLRLHDAVEVLSVRSQA
jgi:uncharacterized protein YcbX